MAKLMKVTRAMRVRCLACPSIALHRTLFREGILQQISAGRARLGPKVLRQLEALRLIVRADAAAVELIRTRHHLLIDQPPDDLAVLENERHLARTHFKHRPRSGTA